MVVKKAWIPAKGTYSVEPSTEPFNPTAGTIKFAATAPKDVESQNSGEKESVFTAAQLLDGNTFLEDYLKVASLANLSRRVTRLGRPAAIQRR